MTHALRCLACGTMLTEDEAHGLCGLCRQQGSRVRAEVGVTAAAPRRHEHAPVGQGDLATRINPVQVQPHSGVAAPEPEEIAVHFPQLEVIDIIGRGGMGVVYKARQRDLQRLVALKVLFADGTSDPTFGERFLREARALARLNHPHIVAVHDVGRVAGLCYLIMEYVDGRSLRQLMTEEPLELHRTLDILVQVCDALHYAHDERIVHRDVKPDNILVDHRGGAKIVDFGIAKLAGRTPPEVALTASRQVMGTLFYMAPEQFERPRTVDQRADIYSLGVVLYELLTGELPLGRFALPSHKAGTDARLDRIVLQALEKQPERRYQRVIDLKRDLQECLSPAPPEPVHVLDHHSSTVQAAAEPAGPAQGVRGPAIALLIAGALTSVGLVVFTGILIGFAASEVFAGRAGGVTTFWMRFWYMMAGTTIGPLLVAAGRRLERLNSHRFVFAMSLLAIVTTLVLPSPFNLLNLPVGVWCLVAVWRKEVKAAFGPREPLDKLDRGLVILTAALITIVACLLGVLVGR